MTVWSSAVPKKVFISYRREDTAAAAGRVYDRLSRLLKNPNVFFDVSTIGGGEDFVKRIESEIGRSDVALVFIGDKWLGKAKPTDEGRIWEQDDYVRAEVRAALARPHLVLPVLVGGAKMPKPGQLPEDIRAITSRNALLLRHESFDDDTENIVAAVLGVPAKTRRWEDKGALGAKLPYALGGALIACALILIVALVHYWILARPLSASIGGPMTSLTLIAGAILGAWIGTRYEARKRKFR
ncbi:MAG TPA: toll/interleukin-1 receptor domain-containing protein [Methyloceanibacter sp.]|nr:toll/interleukin-1 receptor domain-containing protein [Methyloceanibacter sp.]